MESYSSFGKQSWLGWFFRGILFLGLLILLGRLAELQIIKGDYYKKLSEGNRIRRIPLPAPRGRILARGGEVLVGNDDVKMGLNFDSNKGFTLTENLEGKDEEEIVTVPVRNYNIGKSAGHLTGYLGEVGEDEVGKINPDCPEKGIRKLGQLVGRSGLEEEYECQLSGFDGEELVEVDSLGKKVRTLGVRQPIPGQDIKTSIHFGLQKKLSEVFEGVKGAGIVTDPNGEILAIYSSPSFDPNVFVSGKNDKEITKYLSDPDLPLFNRVISGAYHPGSVFKPLIAMAGLEEKTIDRDFLFEDKGFIEVETDYGKFSYSNWYFTQYGGVEGEINVERALTRSTDTFFYKLGEMLGIDKINAWAKKFGLEEKTGVDLPGEINNLIPNPSWKRKIKGGKMVFG